LIIKKSENKNKPKNSFLKFGFHGFVVIFVIIK
jgi:hypothetical protein